MYFLIAPTGMTFLTCFHEHYQSVHSPFLLAKNEVANVTNVTILIELTGINMAAINGDKEPCIAKLNPIKLYAIERIKLKVITVFPDFAY